MSVDQVSADVGASMPRVYQIPSYRCLSIRSVLTSAPWQGMRQGLHQGVSVDQVSADVGADYLRASLPKHFVCLSIRSVLTSAPATLPTFGWHCVFEALRERLKNRSSQRAQACGSNSLLFKESQGVRASLGPPSPPPRSRPMLRGSHQRQYKTDQPTVPSPLKRKTHAVVFSPPVEAIQGIPSNHHNVKQQPHYFLAREEAVQ